MEKGREKSSNACKGAAANKDHKCTVCHKSFCEPKLLPCGHLMCRKCLLSWLKQTRRATCPYCRYPILKNNTEVQVLQASSGSKEDAAQSWDQATEWDSDDTLQATVDQFPTDLSIEVVVKAEQLLNEKKNCHVCDEPATSFCFQCGDTLCGTCRNMHSKLVVTRHHVVEELSGLTTKRLADVQPPTPCPQHPDEPCRLYCPQHDTSLCLLCATSRHRDCPQVAEFDQLVEKSKTKLAELMKVLTNSSTAIDKALSELDQHLADTEQDTETALADIQTLKERLTKAVEDRCQQLVSQASAARDDIREAVKEAKAILLSRQSRLVTHTALAQRVQDSKAHLVVCGMTSVMEVRLKELECHVQLPRTAKVIRKAALLLDQSAARNVEMDLAKLGQIKVEFAAIAASAYEVFHHNHGEDVTLSNDDRKATFANNNRYRVVVVRKPVALDDLVQVEIDLCAEDRCSEIYLGLTGTAPEVIDTHVPIGMIPCSWIIGSPGVICDGKYQRSDNDPGQYLKSVKQGSRVGLLLDHNLHLHLYVDGRDCGVFLKNVAPPCYAMFNFYNSNHPVQITLLPRRKIKM